MSRSAVRGKATNLPVDVTTFVDRRHELSEIRRLLSATRLVTLVGPGGIGKTRLALRAASSLHRTFRDGVWLVELAPLDSGDLIAETLANTLGIQYHSADSVLDVLSDRLAKRHLLIVLDSCEHLVDATAALVGTLLQSAEDVSFLATSHEPLHVNGEHVLAVPALSMPDPDQPTALEGLESYDAVNLFTQRAAAALPGFAVTRDNARTIVQICQRLEGLPLAIELGTAQLRALSPRQILHRLDHHSPLLAAGNRAALPRHRTLRALIDWSFGLCSRSEQNLWARVSVFSGGLDLDAAEEVCSGDGIPLEAVTGLVIGLVDKSILVPEEHGGRVWYRLPDLIREYGQECLDQASKEKVLRRHRDYYRKLAEQAEADWFGPHQADWWARLRRELPNLRTALEFSCTRPDEARSGLRIAAALRIYWISTGMLQEGRRWLDQLIPLAPEPSHERVKALWVNCWLSCLQNDLHTATPLLHEARSLAERLDDEIGLAYTAQLAGLIATFRADLENSTGPFEEALARHRATGDPIGVLHVLIRLASIAIFRGETDEAVALCEESLAMSNAHREQWYRSHALWILGIALWQKDHPVRAVAAEQHGLDLKTQFTDMLGIGNCMEALAWITASQGDETRSATLLGAAQGIWQTSGLSLYTYLHEFHDACDARLRRHLGDKAYNAAFQDGLEFTRDQAIAYALREDTHPAAPPTHAQHEGGEPLTRREYEVAKLVAEGLTNKDIAARLVISQRTAEGHVEHILTKLGFTSRAQIAGWAKGTTPES